MRVGVAVLVLLSSAVAATAEEQASFLGEATYATAEGCQMLKALAAGGDRNISTVPETLTAKGYVGWEHGCSFRSVSEKEAGTSWTVVTSCMEGESEWDDTQVFEKAGEGSFKITRDGEEQATVYAVCDAPAQPKGQ